tara:strand:+ start:82 stop:333 length:252 start_codon:yes stop_codon:yes gene_type:complete
MQFKKSDLTENVVRYTVKTNNIEKGTITFECLRLTDNIKVGQYHKNIQFKDKCGNNMGSNGTIKEILKTEVFLNEWVNLEIID